jgi:tight adherence protein C
MNPLSAPATLHHVLLALVFVATLLLVLAAGAWLLDFLSPRRRRLAAIAASANVAAESDAGESGFTVRVVEPLAQLLLPADDWQHSHLRRRLVQAGLREPQALSLYLAAKLMLGLGLPLLAGALLLVTGGLAAQPLPSLAVIAVIAATGFFAPNLYLLHRTELRQQHIAESFPDALDLLVVCVEAGLGLDAAIQRVGRELEHSHPVLAEELGLLSLELRAGRARDAALTGLAERSGVDDIRAFVSILVQTQHFGTSIAHALREQANDLRLVRMQRAREKAGKLPVKLIFPIMTFIFPAMFLVLLGPAVIRIFVAIISRGSH